MWENQSISWLTVLLHNSQITKFQTCCIPDFQFDSNATITVVALIVASCNQIIMRRNYKYVVKSISERKKNGKATKV